MTILKKFSFKSSLTIGTTLFSLAIITTTTGCQLAENYTKADRSGNMEIQDYRDALAPREVPTKPDAAVVNNDPSIPALQSYVADAPIEKSKAMPIVSIAINQSISLRDALFELAKQADYDLQLDPRIQGSIIYTARNRPLDEVIDQISEIAGLRSSFSGNSVKVELDTPYSQTYRMDLLPFTRNSQSSINNSLSVAGAGGDTGSSSSSGSTYSVENKSENDFWKDLDASLKQIISANQTSGVLKTVSDPTMTLSSSSSDTASTAPPVPPLDPAALSPQAGDESISFKHVFTGGQMVPSTDNGGAAAPTPAATDPATSADATAAAAPTAPAPSTPAASQSVLQVESLPTTTATGENAPAEITSTYSINKSAGIITVFAPESVQKQVADYLSQVKKSVMQQVLIEAKVLEVQLNDEYSNGIDWSIISKSLGGVDLIGFDSARGLPNETASSTLRIKGAGVTAVIEAIARFGTVKALASPRVTVLNNQSAVLNVANNRVFFEIEIEEEDATDNAAARTTVTSTAKTVPEGVLINVMPSIDMANSTIMMQVRPSISKIVDEVPDPGVAFVVSNNSNNNDNNLQSLIPVVSVKEIDTVVQMSSGEAIVMGGLMEDTTTGTQRGVPVANEVPILGNLFKTQDNSIRKSEFVIFLEATILNNPSDSVHNSDKDLYRTFGQDRRPLKM
jgi:MSHA biogenesis protein MshL